MLAYTVLAYTVLAYTVLAYTDVGTILVGWGVTVGVVAGYALLLVRRGKRLSRVVPPEDRRWS